MSRTAQILFAISIAINLFLGGAVTSALIGGFGRPDMGPPGGPMSRSELNPRFIARSVPEEARSEAREVLRTHRGEVRQAFRNARSVRANVLSELKSDTLSEERLAEQLSLSRQADQAVAEKLHSVVAEIIMLLTPEQRRQMMDSIEQRVAERREMWRDRHSKGGWHKKQDE